MGERKRLALTTTSRRSGVRGGNQEIDMGQDSSIQWVEVGR